MSKSIKFKDGVAIMNARTKNVSIAREIIKIISDKKLSAGTLLISQNKL